MSKKYVPSGYQIINVVGDSGSFIENEDSKILFEIINNKKFNKPILLTIDLTQDGYYVLSGFATFKNDLVNIGSIEPGSSIGVNVYIDGESGLLAYAIIEE